MFISNLYQRVSYLPIKPKKGWYMTSEWDIQSIQEYPSSAWRVKTVWYEFVGHYEIINSSGEVVGFKGDQHNGLTGWAGGIVRELKDLYFPAIQRVL